jgi:hypothetical protein
MNEYCGRFFLATDMNGDFLFTISDVWLIAKFIWLLPSKAVVGLLHNSPEIATFFEIGCSTGEGFGGAVFSFFAWFIGLLLIGIAIER